MRKCIKQQESSGCMIACIATILNTDYWSVSNQFIVNSEKEGLSAKKAADYLAGYGFDIIWKTPEYFSDYKTMKSRMLIPFADIHIVSIQQYSDFTKSGHALVMTKDGVLLDPDTGNIFDKSYVSIFSVFGFWYPSDWGVKLNI